MSQLPQIKRIGLVAQLERDDGRRILRGVRRYVIGSSLWHLVHDGTCPVVAAGRLVRGEVDGVIAQVDSRPIALALEQLRVPVVNVSNALADVPFPRVRADDQAIGVLAAEHLIERGYRHLAFYGPPELRHARMRQVGFVARARAAGRSVPAGPGQTGSAAGTPGGPLDAESLSRWLLTLPRPVGIMAGDDQHARHVAFHCQRLGLGVPGEVAIVGVDNDALEADLAPVALTSVDPAFDAVGHRAAGILDACMRGEPAPGEEVCIAPRAVVAKRSTEGLAVDDELVQRAVAFIRAHAAEAITIDDVLDELLVSRRTLEMRFRAMLGHTPHTHLTLVRLSLARRMLCETDLPVHAVAGRAGFTDARQLSAAFRKLTGMTPTAFRSQSAARTNPSRLTPSVEPPHPAELV